jgi:tRNA pseudouridine55 synthase
MSLADRRDSGLPPVPDGILVIDKPEGPTSHDVVALVRRTLGVRRAGHTGTLDPMATGLLAVLLGRATRLAQFFSGGEKVYLARVRLGLETDTWDRTGTVIRQATPDAPLPDAAAIGAALDTFLGERDQVPPPFSAKMVDGVRAYTLARKGKDVPVAPARVTLHAASIEAVAPPCVDVRISCSAGFYVRALAHDLGALLGCGACLDSLRRVATGGLALDEAVTLDVIARTPEAAAERIIPLDRALPALPCLVLNEAGTRRAGHGNEVGPAHLASPAPLLAPGPVRLVDQDGHLLAIARLDAGSGILHPAVVLK